MSRKAGEAEQVMASEGKRQCVKSWTRHTGLPRRMEDGMQTIAQHGTGETLTDPSALFQAEGEGLTHKRSRERIRSQKGVRGGRSTDHKEDTKTSFREGPLLVVDVCVQEVSVRECPARLITSQTKRNNSNANFILVPRGIPRTHQDEQPSVSRMSRIAHVRFERGTLETGS